MAKAKVAYVCSDCGAAHGGCAGKAFSRNVLEKANIKGKMCAYNCGRRATDGDQVWARSNG